MTELFIIGGVWFWLLMAVEIFLLFCFVANEHGFAATVSILVTLACLQWLGDANLLQWLYANPLILIGGVAAYFACGVCWSIFKWYRHCKEVLTHYKTVKEQFIVSKKLSSNTIPPEYQSQFSEWLERVFYNSNDIPPRAARHKDAIVAWAAWWPISLLWYLLHDFLEQVWNYIYNLIAKLYQRISDSIFKDVLDDFKK